VIKRNTEGHMLLNKRWKGHLTEHYRKHDLDGIKNKRKNGGKNPVISTNKNKEMIKDIVLNKSPRTFGYLKNAWSIRLLAIHLSSLLGINANVEDCP
jgi:hypothetical protein